MYRDLTMKEISEQQIGQTLQVAGWVENIRDHGGVSFIDLRDMYGVLQVVIRKPELLKGITKEMCLSITGLMEHRDEETYNPKIPSGTIELEAHKIDVLGRVYKQLPFEIQTSKEIREDVRLKYRYLDLRNAKVKDNIVFRSKVISYLRQKMTDMGFWRSRPRSCVLLRPRAPETILFPAENLKENSMRCLRHRSNISSCSWLPASISIFRSRPASATRMPEQTDLPESSISWISR